MTDPKPRSTAEVVMSAIEDLHAREQTDRQARMAGVIGPSFRCGECARVCRTLGRKKTAAGWRCAACHQAREYRKAVAMAQGVQP